MTQMKSLSIGRVNKLPPWFLIPWDNGEWYGEDQASQVHREGPLDFVWFLPAPKGEVRTSGIDRKEGSQDSVGPTISGPGEGSNYLPLPGLMSPTDFHNSLKEVTFHDLSEISSVFLKTIVSDNPIILFKLLINIV